MANPRQTGRSASFRLRFRFVRACVRAGEAKLRVGVRAVMFLSLALPSRSFVAFAALLLVFLCAGAWVFSVFARKVTARCLDSVRRRVGFRCAERLWVLNVF